MLYNSFLDDPGILYLLLKAMYYYIRNGRSQVSRGFYINQDITTLNTNKFGEKYFMSLAKNRRNCCQ